MFPSKFDEWFTFSLGLLCFSLACFVFKLVIVGG